MQLRQEESPNRAVVRMRLVQGLEIRSLYAPDLARLIAIARTASIDTRQHTGF
jgi:hypothetical protein